MIETRHDSFGVRRRLRTPAGEAWIYDLAGLEEKGLGEIHRLPYSIRILLENLLRHEDGHAVTAEDIAAMAAWNGGGGAPRELAVRPARVLLQDFTGVPAVVDLAAMREAMAELGGDPARVDPVLPSEMVIDHSVQVDAFGSAAAFAINAEKEFERNRERYEFLRWGQSAFEALRVVPPDTGIVHQVNLEYLARAVFRSEGPDGFVAYPDTLVGTDSHTTMINGLGVLGWGVGGIEAEAAMLGEPLSLRVPPVVGFRLQGDLPEGATATDLVLTITERLRHHGVVGKFVEFYGPGLEHLSVADRATLGNMSPEYGATCAISPIDRETLSYLEFTGRSSEMVGLVEAYARTQGLFHEPGDAEPRFTETLELDLGEVEPSLSGPTLPQQRIPLTRSSEAFREALADFRSRRAPEAGAESRGPAEDGVARRDEAAMAWEGPGEPGGTAVASRARVRDGSVVIAAITSCTNTSNPSVMVAAGLLAAKAVERGLERKPWVKSSLAPGSKVVTRYLEEAGLTPALESLGFHLVGYGCTTCIGNSGPLDPEISAAIREEDLYVCSVLSGNRNFAGRINPDTRANYLVSPPLVVAYALAGRMDIDFASEPLGVDAEGEPVFLRELWPSQREIRETIRRAVKPAMFRGEYSDVFHGDDRWRQLDVPEGERFAWNESSTYVRCPPFFEGISLELPPSRDIRGARALALLGDSVTTDHISPAGSIASDSPAADYLREHGVPLAEFNSYGARRGNHEVMMRGTFANIRLRNLLVEGVEGGYTRHLPDGERTSIYEAAMRYREEGVPLIVIAGREYGSGSSRDWAAKGPALLGVRAVIAESFERIHRSNLIGMGVLPLEFYEGEGREVLGLDGTESYDIGWISDGLRPGVAVRVRATHPAGGETDFTVRCRIDTSAELEYYRNGGILQTVLRRFAREEEGAGTGAG